MVVKLDRWEFHGFIFLEKDLVNTYCLRVIFCSFGNSFGRATVWEPLPDYGLNLCIARAYSCVNWLRNTSEAWYIVCLWNLIDQQWFCSSSVRLTRKVKLGILLPSKICKITRKWSRVNSVSSIRRENHVFCALMAWGCEKPYFPVIWREKNSLLGLNLLKLIE